jgi:GT2 family glycosyltransferase
MIENSSIATITVVFNDYASIQSMKKYYDTYKTEINLHILVDNGSEKLFIDEMKTIFKDSIFILRGINGGTTAAYNDGIRCALEKKVDSIMLLASDIEIDGNAIRELNNILFSNKKNGVIAPLLMSSFSENIEQYGTSIKNNMMVERRLHGLHISELQRPKVEGVDMVPGGACLIKREVYKEVGYQDESLFMYGDETDYALRVRNSGYRLLVTSKARAWHQHINTENKLHTSGLSIYYNNRNIMLLNYKYNGPLKTILTFLYLLLFRAPIYTYSFTKNGEKHKIKMYIQGLIHGLFKIINNKYLIIESRR